MKAIYLGLWVLAGLAGLVALPFLGAAILGHVGVLADMSYEENREIGRQALWVGLGAELACIVILLLAWRVQRWAERRRPKAALNPSA